MSAPRYASVAPGTEAAARDADAGMVLEDEGGEDDAALGVGPVKGAAAARGEREGPNALRKVVMALLLLGMALFLLAVLQPGLWQHAQQALLGGAQGATPSATPSAAPSAAPSVAPSSAPTTAGPTGAPSEPAAPGESTLGERSGAGGSEIFDAYDDYSDDGAWTRVRDAERTWYQQRGVCYFDNVLHRVNNRPGDPLTCFSACMGVNLRLSAAQSRLQCIGWTLVRRNKNCVGDEAGDCGPEGEAGYNVCLLHHTIEEQGTVKNAACFSGMLLDKDLRFPANATAVAEHAAQAAYRREHADPVSLTPHQKGLLAAALQAGVRANETSEYEEADEDAAQKQDPALAQAQAALEQAPSLVPAPSEQQLAADEAKADADGEQLHRDEDKGAADATLDKDAELLKADEDQLAQGEAAQARAEDDAEEAASAQEKQSGAEGSELDQEAVAEARAARLEDFSATCPARVRLMGNETRARPMRVFVTCLQSSGCTLLPFLMAQRLRTIAVLDLGVRQRVPAKGDFYHLAEEAFPSVDTIVVKHALRGKRAIKPAAYVDHAASLFGADLRILFVRDPVDNFLHLASHVSSKLEGDEWPAQGVLDSCEVDGLKGSYGLLCGTPEDKLAALDELYANRDKLGLALVRYETVCTDRAKLVEDLAQRGFCVPQDRVQQPPLSVVDVMQFSFKHFQSGWKEQGGVFWGVGGLQNTFHDTFGQNEERPYSLCERELDLATNRKKLLTKAGSRYNQLSLRQVHDVVREAAPNLYSAYYPARRALRTL
jgi:hypothetical protein